MTETPKIHDLKCWPAYFRGIADGTKPFELRFNDRDFLVGDELLLREYDPDTATYTGRAYRKRITYMLRQSLVGGLQDGWCILGFGNYEAAAEDPALAPQPEPKEPEIVALDDPSVPYSLVPVPALAPPHPAPMLTADEWDLVLDALGTEEALAREQQEMWKGRRREARYRREADEAASVRVKLSEALAASSLAPAPPLPPRVKPMSVDGAGREEDQYYAEGWNDCLEAIAALAPAPDTRTPESMP
jgi:hypothetical protein